MSGEDRPPPLVAPKRRGRRKGAPPAPRPRGLDGRVAAGSGARGKATGVSASPETPAPEFVSSVKKRKRKRERAASLPTVQETTVAGNGVDFSRFARPRTDPRRRNVRNHREKWRTFRRVKAAIRLLAYFGLDRTRDTIRSATSWLAGVVSGPGAKDPALVAAIGADMRAVPSKTLCENEFCACLYDGWRTTAKRIRSRLVPKYIVPRGWNRKSKSDPIQMALAYKEAYEAEHAKRMALVKSTVPAPDPEREADLAIERRLAMLTAGMTASVSRDDGAAALQ